MTVIAVDTSVAIPLVVATHPRHAAVAAWAAGKSLVLSGHAAVETYSVLTRLPGDLAVSAADAVAVIDSAFEGAPPLPEQIAQVAHRELAACGVVGGAVCDGLVALAARAAGLILATADARARGTYAVVGVTTVGVG